MTRRPLLASAAGLLVVVWGALPLLPLPPFSAHMIGHMALVVVVAPLVALALAGGPLDPVPRAPRIFSAVPASMIELVLVWAWHAPALHRAAREQPLVSALEQGSFLAAGLLLWMAALGGGPALRRARASGGVTGLLLTSMHMTLLGALLTLAQRPLYAHGGHGGHASSGMAALSPLHDQQIGGAVMLLSGGLAYLVGALWLVREVLRRPPERAP